MNFFISSVFSFLVVFGVPAMCMGAYGREYIGKRFWIQWSDKFTDGFREGKCTDYDGTFRKFRVSDQDKYIPQIKESFLITDQFLLRNGQDLVEGKFDNGTLVCIDITNVSTSVITLESPETNKKLMMQKLEATGIGVGSYLWAKSPVGKVPGLAKVVIKDIDIGYTDWMIFTFSSEKYGTFTENLNIFSVLDKFYLKLPNKLKKLGKKSLNAIANGKIFIGMTKDEAVASWGKPQDINRSAGSWGINEQWVYGDRTYLYFKNGRLTSWQD
ncbi:hypothetical protein [Geotalea sp. SG265]|uniref:hypothetical protein n=1 Tax=Geotalea sp. SG265 TaxID=2922867 RepID=UPI001FAEB85C|nr:hypothetical protein [Geotalea sp. SG265]